MANPEYDSLAADLSAYLDGELSAARTQAVEHLLAESAEARRTLVDLRQVRDQLAALPRLRLPAKLADSLIRRAETELLAKSAPAARRARLLRLYGPLTAVAAVLIVGLFIGLPTLRQHAPTGFNSATPRNRPIAEPASPLAAGREAKESELAVRNGSGESDKLDRAKAGEAARQPQALDYAAKPAPPTNVPGPPLAAVAPAEPAQAEAPMDAGIPAGSIAVVIRTQYAADYASNAAVLTSWRGGADARTTADDQPIEQVYQCQAPELAERLNQILAANPRGQVQVQQGRAAEDSPVVAQVAEALGAPAAEASVVRMGIAPASPGADAKGGGVPDSSARPAAGARATQRGVEPAKSQQRVSGRESEPLSEEAHRRHLAVTEEPDLTIVLVEPPASSPARALAPAQKKAAAPAEQSPKEALIDQLMGLLLRGGPRGGGGQQAAQQSNQPITLRVRLLPPPSPTPTSPAATSPAAP